MTTATVASPVEATPPLLEVEIIISQLSDPAPVLKSREISEEADGGHLGPETYEVNAIRHTAEYAEVVSLYVAAKQGTGDPERIRNEVQGALAPILRHGNGDSTLYIAHSGGAIQAACVFSISRTVMEGSIGQISDLVGFQTELGMQAQRELVSSVLAEVLRERCGRVTLKVEPGIANSVDPDLYSTDKVAAIIVTPVIEASTHELRFWRMPQNGSTET